MSSIVNLNDSNWKQVIGSKPALFVFTTGEGVRGDFTSTFRKAAQETQDVVFGQVHPNQNPILAGEFQVGDKPVLIGWYKGKSLVRRVRPWGSDVTLALELLQKTYREDNPNMAQEPQKQPVVQDKPINVTDATFQQEVIDYSHEMPVLVDFWAAWCGPCRMVAPIMEKLAKEFSGQVRIAKVDTDANPGLAQAFRIMSIPTIMAFKDGQLVFNQAGAFPEPAFRDLIQQLIALDVQAALREAEARQKHK